ncbi:Hypothetical protein A7982_07810 [Minicystis rosea]|nr:Hypothetical protein A7982_07810 [Minicystis rosea]
MSSRRGGSRESWLVARLFAAPAARLTAAIAGGVLAVALIAGAARVAPLLLAPHVPLRLAPVLGRGVFAVALEVALFVAPPIGWALAAARLVERGEARALFATGVSPFGIVARGFPATIVVIAAAGLAAASWGREARAPGRAVRDLLTEARAACVAAAAPATAEVPLLGLTWVCLPGEPPRAVGGAPLRSVQPDATGRSSAFAARDVAIADDLTSIAATDLDLVLPAGRTASEARLHAARASIRGLSPIGRASNLSVFARVLVLASSAAILASVAALVALRRSVQGRVAASAIGAAGPAAALLVFSTLERAPSAMPLYVAVPASGLLAIVVAAGLARLRVARA